ncbi:hypothetical protein N0V93_002263 [Gnomoniopsis smithogilvyi]|uniref:FAD dependent oxidoreductase domain-containing protein n=1 Tax=Gnomoniopsis smithogilvyi TaxID=1191159 RepID=A0A9W9CY01_9PEZI|nr:hypothetical protein N0V93_002263 [Gnomoniopsis smithogilvyi]
MDERAQIPVGLPREEPTVSYWQDPPSYLAEARTTAELPERADIVIVGSGITGAAIAWNLLGPDAEAQHDAREPPSVVMLEARTACSGATGRNGGHTKAASYRSFLDNAATLGTAEAAKIARLELANINAVHAFAREQQIDCESRPCQTVDVIYDEAQWRTAHEAVAAMREALGADDPASVYTFHDAAAVRELFHVAGEDPKPLGGVSYAAGSISAYKLGVGVLRCAVQRGLNLQTKTPVTELVQSAGEEWKVCTPRGTILAKKVVLATNGYTAHLWKPFQGAVVPLRGQVTAHRPGAKMPADGLPGTYSFIYDTGYEYMIPRPKHTMGSHPSLIDPRFAEDERAGDIIIGGGLGRAPQKGLLEYGTTDDTTINADISRYLFGTTAQYFGEKWGSDHPDGRIRREWTGIMGYSPDGFPFVGEVPGQKGLWASCCFQGHGMVFCWMCAKGLVQMMRAQNAGADSSSDLDEWFPEVFKITEKRMEKRFQGRLHTPAVVENP